MVSWNDTKLYLIVRLRTNTLRKGIIPLFLPVMVWFGFFVWWHINLYRLFNAKTILTEEQLWYYLTFSWKDKGICPKVNVIARLEYELAYYDSAVHRFNYYTTRTPPPSYGFSCSTTVVRLKCKTIQSISKRTRQTLCIVSKIIFACETKSRFILFTCFFFSFVGFGSLNA